MKTWMSAALILFAAGHGRDARLVVRVVDAAAAAPIPGAEVTIVGTDRHALTDSIGRARFDRVTAGHVRLAARRVGFTPDTVDIDVPERDSIDAVLTMKSSAQALPAVKSVSTNDIHAIPEFEARLKSHIGGYFVTQDEIEKNQSSTIANLLRSKVPGVRLEVSANTTVVYSTRAVSRCPVLVFRDGVRLVEDAPNVAELGLESLAAIEYYPPGYVPVQYRAPAGIPQISRTREPPPKMPSADCGVLLLWTRR